MFAHCSAPTGFDLFDDEIINEQRPNANTQASDFIVDIREYDVPYHVRVCIDKGSYFENPLGDVVPANTL